MCSKRGSKIYNQNQQSCTTNFHKIGFLRTNNYAGSYQHLIYFGAFLNETVIEIIGRFRCRFVKWESGKFKINQSHRYIWSLTNTIQPKPNFTPLMTWKHFHSSPILLHILSLFRIHKITVSINGWRARDIKSPCSK